MDTRRLERLGGVLTGVTPETALRLARAIEIDRLRGGELPHDDILAALRPKLRDTLASTGPRLPTAQRLICEAFADVLIDRRPVKQRARIARSSVVPVWRWLMEVLIPQEGAALVQTIAERIVNGGPDLADKQVTAFHTLAAGAILAAIPTPDMSDPRVAPAIEALGHADIAADAHDMAQMMRVGHALRLLRRELRRSTIQTLSEEDIIVIRQVWEQLMATQAESGPYLIFGVLGMLEKPWEVMRLVGALSRKMDDILLSRTDFGEIGHVLFSDLELCVSTLKGIRGIDMTADAVVPVVAKFAHLSTGIVRELGIKRDGVWGKRMMTVRAGMSEEMERLLEFAERDVVKSLPMSRRIGLALRARRLPDMSKTPDTRRAERAIEIARLIAGVRIHAKAGAFAGLLNEVDEKICETLRHYTSEMLDVVRDGAAELRGHGQTYVAHAITLTEVLLGHEDAEILRRRVAAASVRPESDANVA